jgi:hypothetical protein
MAVLAWLEWFDGRLHQFHNLGWAALMGILLAVPALCQLRRPERKIATMQQIAVVVVGIMLGYTVSGDYVDPGHVVALTILAVFVAVHPARGAFFRARRPSLPLLAMTLLAAIPFFLYALDQAELQRTLGPGEPHWEGEHWADMAKVALRVLGIAYKDLPETDDHGEEMVETDLTFLGLAGMMGPPREEAIEALRRGSPLRQVAHYALAIVAVAAVLAVIRTWSRLFILGASRRIVWMWWTISRASPSWTSSGVRRASTATT